MIPQLYFGLFLCSVGVADSSSFREAPPRAPRILTVSGNCSSGQYFLEEVCTNCTAGTYSVDGSACSDCPIGQYQPLTGKSSCDNCPAGYYCPFGSAMANPCPSGSSSSASSGSILDCVSCSPGYYASSGDSSCSPCGAGSYAPSTAASLCSNCPQSSYSSPGSSSCTACDSSAIFISKFGAEISSNASFGHAVAVIGDVDGDGVQDIAVGAPTFDDNGANTGAVFIVLLTATNGVKSYSQISNTQLSNLLSAEDKFGSAVAPAGDVNNDNSVAVAVGAPGTDGSGAIYIITLNDDGSFLDLYAEVGASQLMSPAEVFLLPNSLFGSAITFLAPGLNGGGGVDLMVGAPGVPYGGGDVDNGGGIFYLSISGLTTGSLGTAKEYSGEALSEFSLYPDSNYYVGQSIVNLDQRENLTIVAGVPGVGVVYNMTFDYTVGSSPVMTSAAEFSIGDIAAFGYDFSAGSSFGTSLSYGDVNLDGNYDLIIGDPAYENSSLFFIMYDSSNEISAVQQINALPNATLFGNSIAVLNGSGGYDSATMLTSAGKGGPSDDVSMVDVFSLNPTACPTSSPTMMPTHGPSPAPSSNPTIFLIPAPTKFPDPVPTVSPTLMPTEVSDQMVALSMLYDATGGKNWDYKQNWLTGQPCNESWYGLGCDGDVVTRFNAYDNNLIGTLPVQVGMLTSLSSFNIVNASSLTGTIPTQIGLLTGLSDLQIENTMLSGPLPSQIGSLSSLYWLSLMSNKLSGTIPDRVELFTNMQGLFLVEKSVTGTIPETWATESMLFFGIFGSSITGTIPSELGLLTAAMALMLFDNSLTGSIPSELGRLSLAANINSPTLMPTSRPTSRRFESTDDGGGGESDSIHFFLLGDNSLCSDIPAEVKSLADHSVPSRNFTFEGYHYQSFDITTGNSLGTVCCEMGQGSCAPTMVPTPCADRSPTICPLLSCSDDVVDVCETEFCPTCEYANVCDNSCGYCNLSPTAFPTSPSEVPTPAPSVQPTFLPIPIPTISPTATPITSIPTSTPTPIPTSYTHPNCTNTSVMKLTLLDNAGKGWSGERVVVQDTAGVGAVIANLTLVAGRNIDVQWFCVPSSCYQINVGNISGSWKIWLLTNDDDDEEEDGGVDAMYGRTEENQNFCIDLDGIQKSPTRLPTPQPSPQPTMVPTQVPSTRPTVTLEPTPLPSSIPTSLPTSLPTRQPTYLPSRNPTDSPTFLPTTRPSQVPTVSPTAHCIAGEYLYGVDCVNCPAGTYRNESMPAATVVFSDACASCRTGYFSSAGAAECTKCDAGKVSNDEFTACESCVAGTYPNVTSGECVACPLGRYTPFSMDECINCDAGYATGEAIGARTCSSCDPGFYSTGETENCTICPAGQYSFSKASVCVDCESGKYAQGSGNPFCLSCTTSTEFGAGYHAGEGSSTCDICLEGYYYGLLGSKAQNAYGIKSGCMTCPANAYCAGGVTTGDKFQPQPLDGYWIDRAAAFLNPRLVQEVYACPRVATCLKTTISNTTVSSARRLLTDAECTLLENYDNPDCSADASCEAGSIGPLCGGCQTNYKFSTADQKCVECSSSTTWLSAFLFVGLVGILGVLVWSIRSGEIEVPQMFKAFAGDTIHIPILGIFYNMESGTLKLLWATFQIIQSINFNLTVTFPYPYSDLMHYISFFELDFLSIDCYKSGYLLTVYLASAFPIFLSIVCWVLYLFRKFCLVSIHGLQYDGAKKLLWDEHMYAFLLIIYVFVPPVANKQFRALNCQELADGQSYLRADTSVDCNANYYQKFVVYDTILIFIYQCLPLLYVALLFRVRDKLNPKTANKALALELRDNDESLASIRFLFSDYKCSRWYFEIIDLYRRIFFVGILPLLGNNQTIKTYIGCALALLSTIYFRELTPFRVEFTNFLAVIAQYVILLAFMAALMIQSDAVSSIGISNFALGCILVFANILIIGLAMFLGWRRYRRERALAKAHKARLLKVEWAAEFSNNKFQTTLTNVIQRAVPTSHCLCYYYTSLKQAELSVRVGEIPSTPLGVVVSLHGPMLVGLGDPSLKLMGPLAETREAVICISLPHALLFKYEGKKKESPEAQNLRTIPAEVLLAMAAYVPKKKKGKLRAFTMKDPQQHAATAAASSADMRISQEFNPDQPSHPLSLIMRSALRAYQLKNGDDCHGSYISPADFYRPLLPEYTPPVLVQPRTCLEYVSIMENLRIECDLEGTIPLYHYTTVEVADLIIQSGFRMSTQGQGDGGVYLSTQGPSSYNLGSPKYEDNIIIDCFGKERLEEYRGKHKLDICFVYGVNPKCVEQAPGGRENAKVVSKVLFEGFSTPGSDGSYYLRPDFIKAALLIDGSSSYPANPEEAVEELEKEKTNDIENQAKLKLVEKDLKTNSSNTKHVRRMITVKSSSMLSDSSGRDDDDRRRSSMSPITWASPSTMARRQTSTFFNMLSSASPRGSSGHKSSNRSVDLDEEDDVGIEIVNQLYPEAAAAEDTPTEFRDWMRDPQGIAFNDYL